MQAQPDPSDSLVFECDFDEPPEKVWRALTEPRLLEAWLTDDPWPAGARKESAAPPRHMPASALPDGQVSADGTGGPAGSSRYEILTAEPHRLLRYGWQDREGRAGDSGGREVHSVVTVELAPGQLGGTHLRLTHGEFRIVPAAASMAAARVTPITSAQRRRRPILSLAAQYPLRRAA